MAALSLATADRGRSTKVAEPYGPRGRGRCPRGHQLRMLGLNHAPVGQDLGHILLRPGDPRNAFHGPNATRSGLIRPHTQLHAPDSPTLPAPRTGAPAQFPLAAAATPHGTARGSEPP